MVKWSDKNAERRTFRFRDDCIYVFIDEVGNENLNDSVCPFFGYGGWVAFGKDHYIEICEKWSSVRYKLNGDRESSLHARDVNFNDMQSRLVLRDFFNNYFHRVSVVLSRTTDFAVDDKVQYVCLSIFIDMIHKLIKNANFLGVFFVFESSDRLNSSLVDALDRQWDRSSFLRKSVFRYVMPGKGAIPMEIADFCVNCSGSGVKRRIHGDYNDDRMKKKFKLLLGDYHFNQESILASFSDVSSVLKP